MTIDLDFLRGWIGTTASTQDRIAPFPANALAATLDCADSPCVAGSPLPPLWHWAYFLPVFALGDAGSDGHEALGSFLPPVPLPRRMWAGGRLRFLAPLRIGRTLAKVSTVAAVDHKPGRSGDLVFVTVQHRILDGDLPCLEEAHDIVYRAAPAPGAPRPVPPAAPETSAFRREIRPDPVLLFRYSALTFNGHRIHYDRRFCRETEGYPGLVVHGPLLATLLLDLLRRERPEACVAAFDFRAEAPVFDTDPFTLHGTPRADGSVALWVRRHDGARAMTATAKLDDTP